MANKFISPWTGEADALLLREWKAGSSCSMISRALDAELGVFATRNAVTGRLNRLKIPKEYPRVLVLSTSRKKDTTKPELVPSKGRRRRHGFMAYRAETEALREQAKLTAAAESVSVGAGRGIAPPSENLACQTADFGVGVPGSGESIPLVGSPPWVCKFPTVYNQDGVMMCCGARAEIKSYCAVHAAISYVPTERRTTDRVKWR